MCTSEADYRRGLPYSGAALFFIAGPSSGKTSKSATTLYDPRRHADRRAIRNIGSAVVSEGYSVIGAYCVIYSQCHLTPFMEIEDYVFFGPGVVTMSDPAAAHYRPQIVREEAGTESGAWSTHWRR